MTCLLGLLAETASQTFLVFDEFDSFQDYWVICIMSHTWVCLMLFPWIDWDYVFWEDPRGKVPFL